MLLRKWGKFSSESTTAFAVLVVKQFHATYKRTEIDALVGEQKTLSISKGKITKSAPTGPRPVMPVKRLFRNFAPLTGQNENPGDENALEVILRNRGANELQIVHEVTTITLGRYFDKYKKLSLKLVGVEIENVDWDEVKEEILNEVIKSE
eukprot:snap_masked-scaffold_64-processed-gene-0.40-mRNA-1 protein AED:1.00 eAED:1.00 QI:0/-1/0/0/-1/1/1/0/150